MFGLFTRKSKSQRLAEAEAVADIEATLLRAFELIKNNVGNPDSLQRRFNIVAALAAMIAALRDCYPNFPVDDENISLALIQANADCLQPDADGLADAIAELVERCPPLRQKQIDTMMWMIAPAFIEQTRR